jgi:hypothetical protein
VASQLLALVKKPRAVRSRSALWTAKSLLGSVRENAHTLVEIKV